MSDKQTGSEPEIVPVEPKEAAVDGTEIVEPTITEEVVPMSDEDVVAKLEESVKTKPVKESRKVRTVKKSLKSFDKALDEDGNIDFSVLMAEADKNPKGLETFAETHEFDLDELNRELEIERTTTPPEYQIQIEAMEEELKERKQKDAAREYTNTVTSLVAAEGNITLSDFYTQVGEDFELLVEGARAKGMGNKEAAELAFSKIKKFLTPTAEKEALLDNSKQLPLGKTVEQEVEIELERAEIVSSWDQEKRLKYKAKFRNPDNSVRYK